MLLLATIENFSQCDSRLETYSEITFFIKKMNNNFHRKNNQYKYLLKSAISDFYSVILCIDN